MDSLRSPPSTSLNVTDPLVDVNGCVAEIVPVRLRRFEGAVTVNVAVPDLPSTSALIVVVPAFTAVANPDELMVATEVLLLDQAKVLPEIGSPPESRALAMNRRVSPSSISAEGGFTVTVATVGSGGGGGGGAGGLVTVKVALPDLPSTLALIVVEPLLTAVANPDELTVATEVLLLVQVKVLPNIRSSSES